MIKWGELKLIHRLFVGFNCRQAPPRSQKFGTKMALGRSNERQIEDHHIWTDQGAATIALMSKTLPDRLFI